LLSTGWFQERIPA